ncbi:MAG: amidohydrolase family protein [Cyclobacteriaceae bacterium]|nr:amidohydrolase family protein [Cyclobacteriaceae bacterium]
MKKQTTLLALLFGCLHLFGQETAIRNVNVIEVKTGKQLPNYSVLIANEKISWVGPDKKLRIGEQTKIIDGTGKYLIPGLVDAHIHFFQSGSLYTRPDAVDFTNRLPYSTERDNGFNNTTDYFKRYLRLGITTVIDVGGPFNNFVIRDSIRKTTPSPSVLVTGPLFSIVEDKELELNDPPIIKVASTDDVDQLFARMLPKKPDFIKLWYIVDKEHPADKSYPLVQHLATLCAKNNLKLAVHATELETAKLAVHAGATILVHSVDDAVIPDDFAKTLKDKNVTYIPTLLVMGNYYKTFSGRLTHHPQDLKWANAFAYGTLTDIESMDSTSLPSVIRWYRKHGIPKTPADSIMSVNLAKLQKAGVNIATGTDAGNIGTFHASSYLQELEAMRKAGLSNAEILKSSTINATSCFGLADKVGSIDNGKHADLLLLTKNPLESLQNLNSVELIFKNGKPIKADTLIRESPEEIVQRQVNAYNARNLDAFLDTYSDDIEIYQDGKLVMKGREQMRKDYDFLNKVPNLYCEIKNRMVINNKVIDQEKVRFGKQFIHGVAIYETANGKIKKVTFIE